MAARPCVAAFPSALVSNPYCELLYAHLARLGVEVVDGRSTVGWLLGARGRVRVLHFHWPERHFRRASLASAAGFALRLGLARLHNAVPHEGATVGDALVRAALRRLATLVLHCAAARRLVGRAGGRALVIPHGSYVGRYANDVGQAAARQRLGLEPGARVLLAFGQVRPYKGHGELLRAFARVHAPGARLVVAGELVRRAGGRVPSVADRRVRLVLRHVPDDEVQVFLNAADLVVLPYRRVLTSGAAVLALSFGRGVIGPRLGCLPELEAAGAAILYDPEEGDGLERALRRALDVDAARLGRAARRVAGTLSWDLIARRHMVAYGFAPALAVVRGPGRAPGARAAAAPTREARDEAWT
jgi:glycosyltransferase involved in cell wall biosynthesis